MKLALERLGVEVHLAVAPVSECSAEGVIYGDQRLAAKVILWAAGVRASAAAGWANLPADQAGRAKVEADLTAPGHPEIFVIGDTATINAWHGKPVPGIAPAAKQGAHVARTICASPARRRCAANLSLLAYRKSRHHRAACCSHRFRMDQDARLAGLVDVGPGAHLLLDRRAHRLAVALSWLWIHTTGNRNPASLHRARLGRSQPFRAVTVARAVAPDTQIAHPPVGGAPAGGATYSRPTLHNMGRATSCATGCSYCRLHAVGCGAPHRTQRLGDGCRRQGAARQQCRQRTTLVRYRGGFHRRRAAVGVSPVSLRRWLRSYRGRRSPR